MPVKRNIMKFLVPLSVESLGRQDLSGRAVVPFYINPQSISISDDKIINQTLTKGGFSIQYWGERLSTIQVAGTTGSGGVEAINILRAVYRNEIERFSDILIERAVALEEAASEALSNSTDSAGLTVRSILDQITRNGVSEIIDGTKSVIDEVVNVARGVVENNPNSTELIPTLGAFATSMILYLQGEKFLGYFANFSFEENANSPGLFDYRFSFIITKRYGKRSNFMPWHRKPVDATGSPISASVPRDGPMIDELNFLTSTQEEILRGQTTLERPTSRNSISSQFKETQESTNTDINRVPINRANLFRRN